MSRSRPTGLRSSDADDARAGAAAVGCRPGARRAGPREGGGARPRRGPAPRRQRASSGSAGRSIRPRNATQAIRELLGDTLGRLLAERGWDVPTAVAGVTQRWPEIVGDGPAAHCRPEKFDDGVLTLFADSTAWATQLVCWCRRCHQRLDEEVGRGIVHRVEVRGPAGPDWRRGPLRVRGPGPRDTYG